MRTILARKSGRTFLPERYRLAHELCFLNHDVLGQLLRSGEEQGSFNQVFQFRNDADRQAFETADDVFTWLEATRRIEERAAFLRRSVFPALLSDFLHFVYEALETSRKAKLNVAYALLRKPIQENLFLLETIAADVDFFAMKLAENPMHLRSQKAGGLEVHQKRIIAVLAAIGEEHRFDAAYLAQLRYDRSAEDGFDGACNQAVHLFTEHEAIRTESLNINFIFSDWSAKLTQWAYFYSRLPYILCYARKLVEHVFATFEQTDPVYVADIERRLAAATILWADTIEEDYRHQALEQLATTTRAELLYKCRANGRRSPTERDLLRMRASGAWPGEGKLAVVLRDLRYSAFAYLSKILRDRG